MNKVTPISKRKADHIRINLQEDVHSGIGNGLDEIQFSHEALPEINLADIKTKSEFIRKTTNLPQF